MQVNAVSTTSTSSSATPNNALGGDSFMTLLIAQLQAQDPLNPMDPTQFVTQLVQFNSLEQLIQIKQLLTSTSGSKTTPPSAVPKS